MPFSEELKKELAEIPIKPNCCKKALVCGILLDAESDPNTNEVSLTVSDMNIAEAVRKLLSGIFGKAPTLDNIMVVGKTRHKLTLRSRTACAMLASWDSESVAIDTYLGCDNCSTLFLRGAIIGTAMINDPTKEAHLEFRFKHPSRASILYPILNNLGMPPKIVNRKTGCGLYYKQSGTIEDILLQCGAQQSGFTFINDKIEKEIRNTENRVTNCEAKNIQKTVSASHKQIAAIHRIMEIPALWESLPEELRTTARLRMEYEDASLQELLRLHNPPISKSGLNHRLSKIMAIAEEETPPPNH